MKFTKAKFERLLEAEMDPFLREKGFTGETLEYLKISAPAAGCVWIQTRSDKKACCVNLGVDYAFMHKSLQDLRQPSCEVKRRLAPPGHQDMWWDYTSGEAGVTEILALLKECGVPWIESYLTFPEKLSLLTVEDIENGRHSIVLPSVPAVRACVLLAKMYDSLGEKERLHEFACLGIRLSGAAVSARATLKQLLAKYDLTVDL